MSCELAMRIYEQAKDRLEDYLKRPPPSTGDERLDPGPGEHLHEVERLRHAVDLAERAYERAKAEHAEV